MLKPNDYIMEIDTGIVFLVVDRAYPLRPGEVSLEYANKTQERGITIQVKVKAISRKESDDNR